jgi:sigma-B regulation protein RsbU (phosphoserine phosphatase)
MDNMPPGGDRRDPNRIDRRQHPALAGHLELLATMSSHLAVTINIKETMQKALDLVVEYINAEAGSLFILEKGKGQLTCWACAGPVDICGMILSTDIGIVGQCIAGNCCSIVRDVVAAPNFNQSVDESTGFRTRSILCAPMNVQDTTIGAIELLNKKDGTGLFSDHDLMMLQTLASAAALAINNARIIEKLVINERISREIELASQMQRRLLPAPRPASFPISGFNLPAYEVSGDFYDFFDLENGCIYFSLGDVSGKGMNAALLMSKAASLFRCLGKEIFDPALLLATINRELCETAIHGMFVTMICGILDPRTGRVLLANAGHEPPLVHQVDGSFTSLPASVPPLGIIPLEAGGKGIRNEKFILRGATLYLFTDGVTEGRLQNGNRLEAEGLMEIIATNATAPPTTRIQAVVSQVTSEGRRCHDDITFLIVEDRSHPYARGKNG